MSVVSITDEMLARGLRPYGAPRALEMGSSSRMRTPLRGKDDFTLTLRSGEPSRVSGSPMSSRARCPCVAPALRSEPGRERAGQPAGRVFVYRSGSLEVCRLSDPLVATRLPSVLPLPLRPRRSLAYLLVFASAAVGAGLVRTVTTTYLPLLLADIRDAPALIGLAMMVNSAAGFAVPLLVGRWSDRRYTPRQGRRPFIAGERARRMWPDCRRTWL